MHRLGLYVINEMTTGGAVRLKTLKGEPMANFINGRCLKCYNEPMMEEIFEKMHATHYRKIPKLLLKELAQAKSKEHVAKTKARWLQTSCGATTLDNEDGQVPPMLLRFDLKKSDNFCILILNMRADVNSMFEEVYKKLVNFLELRTFLSSFSKKDTSCAAEQWCQIHCILIQGFDSPHFASN